MWIGSRRACARMPRWAKPWVMSVQGEKEQAETCHLPTAPAGCMAEALGSTSAFCASLLLVQSSYSDHCCGFTELWDAYHTASCGFLCQA